MADPNAADSAAAVKEQLELAEPLARSLSLETAPLPLPLPSGESSDGLGVPPPAGTDASALAVPPPLPPSDDASSLVALPPSPAAAAAAAAVDPSAAVIDGLSAQLSAAAHVAPGPEEAPAVGVRRQHVEVLAEEARAEITVHAPGYEHMLSSAKWEDLPLPPDVIRGAYAKGWERPSKIQAQALPYMLRRDHPSLLAQAKNGSGKTGAFGLAMLAAVDPNMQRVQALCMSPTRELAIQTTRVLQQLAQFTGIQSVSVIGGVRYTQPITSHIVVATPGKIQDVLKNRLLDLSALKVRPAAARLIFVMFGDC